MNLIDRINFMPVRRPVTQPCISMSPENYASGGGFLDDVDVTLVAFKFIVSTGTPYDKPGNKVVPLLKVDILPDGPQQEVRQQYFSCGDLDHWSPTGDGETLEPKSDKAKASGSINKSTNAAIFLSSMVTAGVPSTKLASEKISDLNGIKAHLVKVPRPKDNFKKEEGAKENTVLTVNRIISVPWGDNGTQALAAVSFTDGELVTLACDALKAKGGSMKKSELAQAMLQAVPASATVNGKPARPWAVGRIDSNEFLKSVNKWHFNAETGVVEVIPF